MDFMGQHRNKITGFQKKILTSEKVGRGVPTAE